MIKKWLIIKHKEFYQVGSVFFEGFFFEGRIQLFQSGLIRILVILICIRNKIPGRENEAGEGRSGQAPRPATDEKQGRQPTYQKNIINNQ